MRFGWRRLRTTALKVGVLCLIAVTCFYGVRFRWEQTESNNSLVDAMKRFADSRPKFVVDGGVIRHDVIGSDSVATSDGASQKNAGQNPDPVAGMRPDFVSAKQDNNPPLTENTKPLISSTKIVVDDPPIVAQNKKRAIQLFDKWEGYTNIKMPKLFDPMNPPKEMNISKKQWTEKVYFEEPTYPPKFKYLINNENLCGKEPIDVIAYVHTTPDHHARRNIIRETWGNIKTFTKVKLRVIFLLGVSDKQEDSLRDTLKYEQALYNDIIKGDFIDSYKNLTLKAIMGLHWIGTYCSQARYVLKSDDDMLINIFAMLRYLYVDHNDDKRFIACYAWPHNGLPNILRDPNSCLKWCVDKKDLVGRDTYPRYCAGAGFVMTTNVAMDLYNASQRHPFFWVDDAYLTGLLPRVVPEEIKYFHFDHLLTMHPPTADKAVLESPIVKILVVNAYNGGGEEKRALFWKSVVEKKYPDLKKFGIE